VDRQTLFCGSGCKLQIRADDIVTHGQGFVLFNQKKLPFIISLNHLRMYLMGKLPRCILGVVNEQY
jgi:hypothetical protein